MTEIASWTSSASPDPGSSPFDPPTGTFMTLTHDSQPAEVRQLLGRPGEVWGAESAADRLVVVQFGG
jgi:streptogramin lyase